MNELYSLVERGYKIEKIATGFVFTEGPVWNKEKEFLLFSDVRGNVRIKWSKKNKTEEAMRPSNKCNGMTYDREGNLIVCEHITSTVVKEYPDGKRETIASHHEGRELNSPNDVIVAKDGSIYFTDPNYGRMAGSGLERNKELAYQGIYRINPGSGELELLSNDFTKPNGLCLSPDEKILYIDDSRFYHIRAFDVSPGGSITNGRVFFDNICSRDTKGSSPDGMKCDELGNIYVAGHGGIWVISPQAEYIGLIELPEVTSNLNWGGENWDILYITASTSVYRLKMKVRGNKLNYMK